MAQNIVATSLSSLLLSSMGSAAENTTVTENPAAIDMGASSTKSDNRSAEFVDESSGSRIALLSLHAPSAAATALACVVVIALTMMLLGCCIKLILSNYTRYSRMRHQASATAAMRNLEARTNAEQVQRMLNANNAPVTVSPTPVTTVSNFRGPLTETM